MTKRNFSFSILGSDCPPRLPSIKIGFDIIKPTTKARNIGVIFDNTITMSFRINNVVKGAFYHLRNIAS